MGFWFLGSVDLYFGKRIGLFLISEILRVGGEGFFLVFLSEIFLDFCFLCWVFCWVLREVMLLVLLLFLEFVLV